MIRTQIYIPDELHQAVKIIAHKENEPFASIVRDFILQGVKEKREKIKSKPLSSLAKLNITQGPKNLSRDIDTYLYQE